MSGAAQAQETYAAVEESARLMGAPCSQDKVRPVLAAYEDALAEAGVVVSVATGERHAGELDYTVTMPPEFGDPYAVALSNGFAEKTDHPVGALLADIRKQCSVSEYMIDCGVVGGFKKVYAHFPQDMQTVAQLAEIPSMPPAVTENAGLFARHGLDKVAMIGIDYQNRTTNLYFSRPPAEPLKPENIRSMLREIGVPEPDEHLLELAQKSFRVYVTLGWDSSHIARITFAHPPGRSSATPDLATLSTTVEPAVERFVKGAPYTYAGERVIIFAITWSPGGEYVKLGSYCRVSPVFRKLWTAFYKEQI